jgi:magnesium chelatase family protein
MKDSKRFKLPTSTQENSCLFEPEVDFSNIRGQILAKRALQIVAAGGHNILMVGSSSSSNKTLAKSLISILPPMNTHESMEVTKITSVSGNLSDRVGLIRTRPFRSLGALMGERLLSQAGEIALAHNGVLFLDDLPKFHPQVLEDIRRALEDGFVSISGFTFPTKFILAAAFNPYQTRQCMCKENTNIPLLDLIDLHITVRNVSLSEAGETKRENANVSRKGVFDAILRQKARFKGTGKRRNSEMSSRDLTLLVQFSSQARHLLTKAYNSLDLSVSTYYKTMKIATTIADLDDSPRVEGEHIAEALIYRANGVL